MDPRAEFWGVRWFGQADYAALRIASPHVGEVLARLPRCDPPSVDKMLKTPEQAGVFPLF